MHAHSCGLLPVKIQAPLILWCVGEAVSLRCDAGIIHIYCDVLLFQNALIARLKHVYVYRREFQRHVLFRHAKAERKRAEAASNATGDMNGDCNVWFSFWTLVKPDFDPTVMSLQPW